jgi:hypothetical protein
MGSPGIGRLLFQNIEACSGNAALLKHFRKRFLIDNRAREPY